MNTQKNPPSARPRTIVVGTRGSALALVQAAATEAALKAAFPDIAIERKIIRTTGDRRTDVALAEVAKSEGVFDKGVFIKEIEDALAAGEVDLAVHSLKDLPTVLDARFELAAVLERAPVRDVWIARDAGHGPGGLPAGGKVGTSSVRRARQIAHIDAAAVACDLRGNVPTRLRKLASGECDAIVLAEAGLLRLGILAGEAGVGGAPEPLAGHPGLFAWRLDESIFLPAAGQGAVGLEIRAGDEATRAVARAINHPATWLRISAEREFLRLLDGGCHTPVGVFSTLDASGALHLKARVFPDGEGPPRHGEACHAGPEAVAHDLYQSLQ